MSNPLAIAAATATLRNLIAKGVSDFPNPDQNITTKPLDKVRSGGATPNQINIFLYQTILNAAWRNLDMPRQVRPGETGQPPLALNLHYLITAYGENDDETKSHRWLGKAMSVLHDHPVLGAQEIQDALADSGLQSQIERVRITPQPLTLEEMSKLWAAFQTQYRISAAYAVEVVLIESTLPVSSPLPVLKRGSQDQGVFAVGSPSPALESLQPDVQPPGSQPAAKLGDGLIISGENLSSENVTVRFIRQPMPAAPALPETIELTPHAGDNENELKVSLPKISDDGVMSQWAPGFYNVSLVVKRPSLPSWVTNEIPLPLMPVIIVAPLNATAGDVTLNLTCAPRLRDGQRVLLLFGSRQIPPQNISNPGDTTKPTELTFLVPGAAAGRYVVRLRVDGVDSFPVVKTGTPPVPAFDPQQTVVIA
jgi:Pvc16 N-terminal domain